MRYSFGGVGTVRLSVFGTILVAAIAVNVIQFRSIDEEARHNYTAIHQYETDDFIEIGVYGSRALRDLYGLHFALALLAPHSTVITSQDTPYTSDEFGTRIHGFGRVKELVVVPGDGALLELAEAASFDPGPHIVASGEGGQRGAPWAVAVDMTDGEVGAPDAPERFLRRAVRDGTRLSEPPGDPRRFALLQWPMVDDESGHGYMDLLVEMSLLPQELRTEFEG